MGLVPGPGDRKSRQKWELVFVCLKCLGKWLRQGDRPNVTLNNQEHFSADKPAPSASQVWQYVSSNKQKFNARRAAPTSQLREWILYAVVCENGAKANPTCLILGVVLGVRLVSFWGPFGPSLERNVRFWKSPSQNTWFLKKDTLIYIFGVPPRTPRRVQTPTHKTEFIIKFFGCPRGAQMDVQGTLKSDKTAPTL